MAREKGTGSLQLEKSGRWTMRVGIKGKRYSRSTRTTDREKAEKFLERFLSPLGLGSRRLPLADVWLEYVKSPNRNELARATMNGKRLVWMHFAKWMEHSYLAVDDLAGVTPDMIGEYLACLRVDVCASTYNGRVCVLREIFRTLADKAGLEYDPWEGVRLRPDDSHSRRELTMSELERLLMAAKRADVETAKKSVVPWRNEWRKLFLVGIYTGMRLGDCCRLSWTSVNLSSGIIQLVPQKTKRHHGRIVTIPIHPALRSALEESPENERNGYVLSTLADYYMKSKWRVGHELGRIFRAAGIVTSIQIEGRRTKTPEATFHSLRHTFVSFAANAGVPLHIVQSIVGHESTAMTRHYYHENEDALRQAVAAIPAIGTDAPLAPAVARVAPMAAGGQASAASAVSRPEGVPSRLRRLDRYRAKGLITEVEYDEARQRIIGEI